MLLYVIVIIVHGSNINTVETAAQQNHGRIAPTAISANLSSSVTAAPLQPSPMLSTSSKAHGNEPPTISAVNNRKYDGLF